MSIDSKGPGGSAPIPGGNEETNQAQNTIEVTDAKPSSPGEDEAKPISRESYLKAVTEAKNAKARAQEFEARWNQKAKEDAEKEEKRLLEEQNYKTLYERTQQRAKELEEEKARRDLEEVQAKKLSTFLKKLPGTVDDAYWNLIDLDSIDVDPETGKVLEDSVVRAAREFEAKHARLIDRPKTGRLPGEAAKGVEPTDIAAAIAGAKTQKELDAVLAKYGKA